MWSQQAVLKRREGAFNKSPDDSAPQTRASEDGESPTRAVPSSDRFKQEIIKDILSQVDYQAALKRGIVDVLPAEIAKDLELLPTRTLVAWYEAFLYIRSELMFAGYELNGLKLLDRPADAIRTLMETDPNFDIRQYIF